MARMAMLKEKPRGAGSRRPEHNRQALISAALDSVAEDGITDATVSRIIQRAGLSRGMIHLHFGGKDNLLAAAAEAFSVFYYDEMDRQTDGLEDNAAELILAIIRADLSEEILSDRSARIWHAFRGVAHSHPGIARFSDTRDRRLRGRIRRAFDAVAADEGCADAAVVARDATYGTLALLEGMWTDYLTHPDGFSREAAERIIRRFLNGLFPSCFGPV